MQCVSVGLVLLNILGDCDSKHYLGHHTEECHEIKTNNKITHLLFPYDFLIGNSFSDVCWRQDQEKNILFSMISMSRCSTFIILAGLWDTTGWAGLNSMMSNCLASWHCFIDMKIKYFYKYFVFFYSHHIFILKTSHQNLRGKNRNMNRESGAHIWRWIWHVEWCTIIYIIFIMS